jgi:hypothetical protein
MPGRIIISCPCSAGQWLGTLGANAGVNKRVMD